MHIFLCKELVFTSSAALIPRVRVLVLNQKLGLRSAYGKCIHLEMLLLEMSFLVSLP